MKPLLKDKRSIKICIPIIESTPERALKSIKIAKQLADLIEIRADYLNNRNSTMLLLNQIEYPFIFTCRKVKKGEDGEVMKKKDLSFCMRPSILIQTL